MRGKNIEKPKEFIVMNCLQMLRDSVSTYYIEDALFEKYDTKVDVLKAEKETWNLSSLKMILSTIE